MLSPEDRREVARKNVFEDFRESLAAIASKRRVSSDRLLSKTFSQRNPKTSPVETPLASLCRKNVMTSCQMENKPSCAVEKSNKNLKKMHRKFTLKIENESKESETVDKIQKSNPGSRAHQQVPCDHGNFAYVKTEPCYPSKKESLERPLMPNDAKASLKAKKRSRVNKVYSMQQTITDHLKSRLDQRTASNIGTTEEEFESEEISEGENNPAGKDPNKLDRCAISEGVIYGKGGIPVNSKGKCEEAFSIENKENMKKKENEQKVCLLGLIRILEKKKAVRQKFSFENAMKKEGFDKV